jgi:hypothetical protein
VLQPVGRGAHAVGGRPLRGLVWLPGLCELNTPHVSCGVSALFVSGGCVACSFSYQEFKRGGARGTEMEWGWAGAVGYAA